MSGSIAAADCELCEKLRQKSVGGEDPSGLLRHIESANYFELFGLRPSYRIDAGELTRSYLAICRHIHPDRFPVADGAMQSFALRASAVVNRAYNILRDDFARGEYLLESAGGKSASEDKTVAPELLGQVLMLREEIEDAKAAGDAVRLTGIGEDVRSRRDALQARVAELFGRLREGDDSILNGLRIELNSLKYLNNLLFQVAP